MKFMNFDWYVAASGWPSGQKFIFHYFSGGRMNLYYFNVGVGGKLSPTYFDFSHDERFDFKETLTL